MERITSKLTGAFAALLLCVAAVTTANSQENPTKVIDLNVLAARGQALANEDPLALELRNRQPDDSARRGFDIGMAVAEGHTAPGPGKDRIGASLPREEQSGFSIAVSFSLERNRNAKLASTGAKIANGDEIVAAARTVETDVFYRLGFYIGMAAAEGHTAPGPGKQKIHDSLISPAAQGGFDTAVAFSLDRNRNADLATRGAAIVKSDPIVSESRPIEWGPLYRLGFYIGMAAAEGQTLPGPGKQKIHDSLISLGALGGFEKAVAFSLERNRNADFAARGAKIAKADPVVAEARNVSRYARGSNLMFYRLGFDVATGIFGDPALGAQGNTATGLGSLKIRDSLSAAGQRGFNDSVKLHLSRNYKR